MYILRSPGHPLLCCLFLLAFPFFGGFGEELPSGESGAAGGLSDSGVGEVSDGSGESPARDEAMPPGPAALDVEALRQRITNEANAELVSLKLGDSEVSLQVSGFWKGTLQGNFGLSFTPLGTEVVSPDSPILFTQEADLTLSLWIRNRWFVEAGFLDDYDLNTYRAGYQGFAGEPVQYVGIGNTGLDFPIFPYLDLGGDSPSSFGLYGRFGGRALQFHTLFRYDAAAREERTFVGNRERTYTYVSLDKPLPGLSFVLPDTNLDSPPLVYLEDSEGNIRDNRGRRWRQAGPSEYAVGRAAGLVELGGTSSGAVAVAYSKAGNSRPWEGPAGSLGEYDTSAGPGLSIPNTGSGFLGSTSAWFGPDVNLRDFPQPGEESPAPDKPGTIYLDGTPALVIHEEGTFSPFERQSRYEAPSSSSSDAALVRLSTGERIRGYELIPFYSSSVTPDIPLYASTETRRGIFSLLVEGSSNDLRAPETRWPLAGEYPEIYLPGSPGFSEDKALRFVNYGSAGAYSIGTDVVPGSVQVWRSGLQDPNINYNAETGTVALASPAGFNEVIRITYLRRSSETRLGSIAAGLGAVYNNGGPFSSELALGLRWNLTAGSSHTEEGISNPGTVGLGAKAAWETERLKAQVSAGLGFEQPDTTGLYRAAGMEGNEIVLALIPENSFISEAPNDSALPGTGALFSNLTRDRRADLVYRNYRENTLGGTTLNSIDWGGAPLVSGKSGPYPARDSSLTKEAVTLVAEFSLSPAENWTGFEAPVGADKEFLKQAKEIEIPFRFYDFNVNPPGDFRLVLQIGSLSAEDRGFVENPALIFESLLFDSAWASLSTPPPGVFGINRLSFNTNPRIARFVLSDEDRRKLGDAKFLRLIAVRSGPVMPGLELLRGRVILAPPILRGAGWRPLTVRDRVIQGASDPGAEGSVKSTEIRETGAGRLEDRYGDIISRLHSSGGGQQVLEVSWKGMTGPGRGAGADGRISALPLANYRTVTFFVRGPIKTDPSGQPDSSPFTGGTFNFIIARGPESLAETKERYLEAEIPLAAFTPGEWSEVNITYRGSDQGIRVGGRSVSGSFNYRPPPRSSDSSGAPGKSGYAAVFVSPEAGAALPDGFFRLDEIILENSSPLYRLNGGARLEYSKPGTLLAVKDSPLLTDLSFSTALESEVEGDPFIAETEAYGGVVSRSNAAVSFLKTKLLGNLAFNAAPENFSWNAGHGISRSWGPFSAEESFSMSRDDETIEHRLGLGFSSVVSGRFDTEAYYEEENINRRWNASLGFKAPRSYIPSLTIDSAAAWKEKTDMPGEESENYAQGWVKSWEPMIPDLGGSANTRDTRGLIKLTEDTKPVGAALSFEGSTTFSELNNSTRSFSAAGLGVPVDLGFFGIDFEMGRSFRRHLRFAGENALGDGDKFAESIGDSLPLWGVVPFYSLFTPSLNDAMDKGLRESPSAELADYTLFNDRFGFKVRLPAVYDFRSFFTPVSAGGTIQRMLEQKMDTRIDMLSLGGSLDFSALNMFGAFGVYPFLKFYQGDEFSHTLEAALAIPRDEDLSWRAQSALGMGFHGFTGGELGMGNTLTIGSAGWAESLTLDWTVPTRRSLLSIFYGWIASIAGSQSSWLVLADLMNAEYEQLRKETLELSFSHDKNYLRWDIVMGHESIIRIFGRLNFSVFAKLGISDDELTKALSFIATIGTSLNLSF
ncbi:MAG: hypothetical protein LBJ90_05350 [Treponema sp.]|jgi:hypothetical protein|nr:hypothetical protein [Treponema sp.]